MHLESQHVIHIIKKSYITVLKILFLNILFTDINRALPLFNRVPQRSGSTGARYKIIKLLLSLSITI